MDWSRGRIGGGSCYTRARDWRQAAVRYFASLLLIGASAFAMPALVDGIARISSRLMKKCSESRPSLRRAAFRLHCGALPFCWCAIDGDCHDDRVGIMVGSFRETVLLWMDDQLLQICTCGRQESPRRIVTQRLTWNSRINLAPSGVAAIDRLREYEISYEGMPAGLGFY